MRLVGRNLWWSWHAEVINLFRDLDPIRWRQLDHNPIALLSEFTPERLEMRASELVLYSRISQAYRRLKEYVSEIPSWGRTHAGVLGSEPVAYFSLEFGVHESVPIYSGGLGVLSGDHIKSASGLGVPLVAIGLFYDQGYFKQHLDTNGWQHEEYLDTKVENLPMEPALGTDGKPITVRIDTRTGKLLAKVWLMRVGRVNLYLLDCDVQGNSPEDRELTARLYGGDNRTRIRQELVAGVGGVRALRAVGITPGVFHLNEGHSAFATLEATRTRMKDDGMPFDAALREVAQHTVFTTHTPVPAGHDRFDRNLIEEHLGPLRDELGISTEQLMGLGRVEPQNEHETFCMTVLGLKLSRRANAVSNLHGHITRRMWAHLWPWRVEEEIPIGHITNGVHIQSWLAWQMQQLYDRYFPAGWMRRMGEPDVWQMIHEIDPGELWETHYALKNLLLAFVRRRISRQCRRRGESDDAVEAARNILDPNILTLGFARRFATYKRAAMILSDFERLAAMVNDPRAADTDHFRRQGPSGRRARQTVDPADRQPAARSPLRRTHGLCGGLRHQRLPAPDSRGRRVAEQSPPAAGGLRHQRPEGRAQRGLEPVDSRRVVGRGLRRQQRLRHRQGHLPRRRPRDRFPRCRRPVSRVVRGGHSALLRPRHQWPAAPLDQADDELHQLAGLAVQCRPHGGRLCSPRLLARRRRLELRYECEIGARGQRTEIRGQRAGIREQGLGIRD